VFKLDKTRIRIGRDTSNDIVLGYPSVSRRHAAIDKSGDNFVITDLGSTHGTFVNGERVAREKKLRHRDKIAISEIEMVFEDA
jgi:pSer/pThr/pTyr-binding forkhead associated (FHA) protein